MTKTEHVEYIYIQDNGTPEEFKAWAESVTREADEEPSDDEAMAQFTQWYMDHQEELEREEAEANALIDACQASQILSWHGSTAHPDRLYRTFMLATGGAMMKGVVVAPGQSLPEAAAKGDEIFRAEGWAVPVADRYEVVYGSDPSGGLLGARGK